MKAAGPMYRRSTLQARVPSPEKPGVKGAQSCPTVCDPRDYTAHGILQSRVLEPVAFPFSGDLPNPGIELRSPALQTDSLPAEPQGKLKNTGMGSLSLLQQIFLSQEWNPGLLHCRQLPFIPFSGRVTDPAGTHSLMSPALQLRATCSRPIHRAQLKPHSFSKHSLNAGFVPGPVGVHR